MPKPYAQLRAQMSPEAQALAAAQAQALLQAMPPHAPGGFEAAYAQWLALHGEETPFAERRRYYD